MHLKNVPTVGDELYSDTPRARGTSAAEMAPASVENAVLRRTVCEICQNFEFLCL